METPPPLSEVQPATPQPPPMSLPARLMNVLAGPGEVFDRIKASLPAASNWLVPALLFALVGAISCFVIFSQPAIVQQIHEQQAKKMDELVKAGLMKVNRPDSEVQAAMDEAALRELPKIESRTPYLALLANLAMLCGLFGTVTGLIAAFGAVANADAASRATMLARGISEAMNCTAFGLFTGILGLASFAYLNGRTQNALDDIAEVKKNVSNLLFQAKAALRG